MNIFLLTLALCVNHIISTLTIDVYYESLCPGCSKFISQNFKNYLDKNKLNTTIINFIPAGFSNETYNSSSKRYEFKCHHGPNECYGNIVSACFIDILGRVNSYKYLVCLETIASRLQGNFTKAIDMCTRDSPQLKELVNECANGEQGNKLIHFNIQRTKTDKMEYVPYITVNGVFSEKVGDSILKNLYEYLCSKDKNVC